ncbi:MAG: DUF929 family protein [Acidimicrobiales bacterium]|nr:DUF929 family protein [Acidimicrobiales bacterium]
MNGLDPSTEPRPAEDDHPPMSEPNPSGDPGPATAGVSTADTVTAGAAAPDVTPPLSRTVRFAWGMVIAIVIGLIALVIYVFTRPPPTESGTSSLPTPPAVVSAVASVPASVFAAVGAQVTAKPTPLTPPHLLTGQPRLVLHGKPEVLYVGAEYCPFCATERWPLVVALSRFGHFTGLEDTQSAGTSVFASIQTFSFADTRFDSPYLSFTGVELYSDELDADGGYAKLDTLTPAQESLVARYGNAAGPSATAIPFVDIGNRMVATTSPFTPGILTRQSQGDIVAALDEPGTLTGQAVIVGANQLTAGICQVTGQRPAAVCDSKGVRDANAALGLA